MKKHGVNKFIVNLLLFSFIFTMLFSFCSFADSSTVSGDININTNNGDVSALSGNVYIDNAQLGSNSQMDTLVNTVKKILFYVSFQSQSASASDPWTKTVNYDGVDVTINKFMLVNYQFVDGQFTESYSYRYGNYFSYFVQVFAESNFPTYVRSLINSLSYTVNQFKDTFIGQSGYYMYSFNANGETYYLSGSNQNVTWRQYLDNRYQIFLSIMDFYWNRFFNWYYPLDNTLPEYWRFYNTDTQEEEDIGLAGLMYNISWYLGQLYALQVESGPLTQLAEDVATAGQSMADMEAQEESVISSISSGINSFVPDLSELGAFTALAWCSNYLQQCYVSLGMYGTVIMIGLLLAVCMQFIGYFRYK